MFFQDIAVAIRLHLVKSVTEYYCGCGRWRDLCQYKVSVYIGLVVVVLGNITAIPGFLLLQLRGHPGALNSITLVTGLTLEQ